MDITEEITQHPNGVEKRKYTRKNPTNKKSAHAPKVKAKQEAKTFLFFKIGSEEYTELVSDSKAEQRALAIFTDPDYKKLKKIYFMKPLRLYHRPKMQVEKL